MQTVTETTLHILLQLGHKVLVVDKEHTITDAWIKHGKHDFTEMPADDGTELPNSIVMQQCAELIDKIFASNQSEYTELSVYNGNELVTYSIHLLMAEPEMEKVYVTIQKLDKEQTHQYIEDKWKFALDASGDGVWDVDMEKGTITFSDKWQDIFGYGSSEITKVSDWVEKVHPDDVKAAELAMQQYLSGQVPIYSLELRYRCEDGNYKWILSRGVVMSRKTDGSPLRFIGTHKDINERKQAEEDLRLTKEMFSNFFQYSGTGKALIDPSGQWIDVNDAICRYTGYTKEELLSRNYKEYILPEDFDSDKQLLQQLIHNEIPAYTIRRRYISKTRKVISTLLTVTLIRDNNGEPKFFACDIVDITSLTELSGELSLKNTALESASAQLNDKINQLEETNHIIAHNLRGGIANIKFLSDGSGLFPVTESMQWINESANKILDELDTLFELSKINLNKDLVNEYCEFDEIIDSILTQLHGSIFQKNITVQKVLKVSRISYHKAYLHSIIYNLISNAVKYSREEIRAEIIITTTLLNGRVVLSIKDNGLGIDLDRFGTRLFGLNQIFHPGFDSQGVGLFLTKTQIERLGGKITVKSVPNEGAEFIVTF